MVLVTATTRLSRELRQDYDRKQEATGLSSWPTAQILPFSAWLSELWTGWLYSGPTRPVPRLLRPAEERVVWESIVRSGVLTPLYVKTRVLSGLGDGLACAEVCHDALGDLSRKEAFQASDDLAFGPAIGGASGDVVAGWLVESHADDDGSIEGGVGVSVTAPIEPMPAGASPGRGRDRTGATQLRERGFGANPVRVIAEDDQQLGRGVGAHTEALTEGR